MIVITKCCWYTVQLRCDGSVNLVLHIFHVDSTVSFSISNYMVNEKDRTLQITVILSNPLSTNVNMQVTDNSNTASSK